MQLAATAQKATFKDKQVLNFPEIVVRTHRPHPVEHPLQIVNGRFVIDGRVACGASQGEALWKGSTSPAVAYQLTGSSIARSMPGQFGPGMTEGLLEFALRLKKRGVIFLQVGPGLWYDHRRDSHTIISQPDGTSGLRSLRCRGRAAVSELHGMG
jgi:hypothetical protein